MNSTSKENPYPLTLERAVGYCGLVCEVCINTKSLLCLARAVKVEVVLLECSQRRCCLEKGINGCWQCDVSPCDRGFFAPEDEAWSGLCRGFIHCIKNKGVSEFLSLVQSKLGSEVEYSDLRFKKERQIVAMLCDSDK